MEGKETIGLEKQFVSTQSNTTGEFSEIIEVQAPAGKEFQFHENDSIQLFAYTHEQFTHGGTGVETFNLTNDLVNSPSVTDVPTGESENAHSGRYDIVVWDNNQGNQVGVESVDYANDSFDYDSNATPDLDVYYLWQDTSKLRAEAYVANEQSYAPVYGNSFSALHSVQLGSSNERQTFRNSFKLGPKEKLKFFVNTQVDLENWDDTSSGSGPNSSNSFSYLRLPVTIRDAARQDSRGRNRGFNVRRGNAPR